MNKFIFSTLVGAFALLTMGTMSCGEEKLTPRPVKTVQSPQSPFDIWLTENYIKPYNIEFKYKFESDESTSTGRNVVPAKLSNSIKIARTLKHTWMASFEELCGSDFMRLYAPRIITLTGTPTVNDDGTVTLGQAEGGLKISLTNADAFDASNPEMLNELFLHTMYHEFTHILHQNRIWDQNFSLLSSAGYTESGWQNRDLSQYAKLGFLTAYSARNAEEDITEVTSCYITFTEADWSKVRKAAGAEGNKIIDRKIEIVKDYMTKEWNIDMDKLRELAVKKAEEIGTMTLIEPEWQDLVNDQLRAAGPMNAERRQLREVIIQALVRNPKQLQGDKHNRQMGGSLCQLATQYRGEIAEASRRLQ